jgi:nitric oxide reductase subunit C
MLTYKLKNFKIMLSKSQAKVFFLGGTFVTFAIFLGLSWNSLSREVPQQTHEENLSPQVVAGKHIWEKNNCMGCHTLFGEGAYYAPELTKVYERRGEPYIKTVLMSQTPWSPRGRKMVAYAMTEAEANDVVAFLKWIGEVDLNGFPPKPDLKK